MHQFWHNLDEKSVPAIPVLAALSMRSFVARSGCKVRFWSYDTEKVKLPPGCEGVQVCDAHELVPLQEFDACLRNGVEIAHLADWLRFECLWRYGGWWADTDAVCIRTLPRTPARIFQTIPIKRVGGFAFKREFYSDARLGQPGISVIKVPKEDPLMAVMASYTRTLLRDRRGKLASWNQIVFKFCDEVIAHAYTKYVVPPIVLAPLFNGHVPTEQPRKWYGSVLDGYVDIRAKSYVLDFFGSRFKARLDTVYNILRAVDPSLCTLIEA